MSDLKTPQAMATDLIGAVDGVAAETMRTVVADAIAADRAHVAEWLDGLAAAAEREAKAHDGQCETGFGIVRDRVARCDGQAVALRSTAKLLKQT